MKAKFLDVRTEGSAECILCSASLGDYVSSLPDTYQSYDIQRGTVSNVYLDRLVDTVLKKRHIPIITLVSTQRAVKRVSEHKETYIDLGNRFRILDGLQRTHRLEAINATISLCLADIPP